MLMNDFHCGREMTFVRKENHKLSDRKCVANQKCNFEISLLILEIPGHGLCLKYRNVAESDCPKKSVQRRLKPDRYCAGIPFIPCECTFNPCTREKTHPNTAPHILLFCLFAISLSIFWILKINAHWARLAHQRAHLLWAKLYSVYKWDAICWPRMLMTCRAVYAFVFGVARSTRVLACKI